MWYELDKQLVMYFLLYYKSNLTAMIKVESKIYGKDKGMIFNGWYRDMNEAWSTIHRKVKETKGMSNFTSIRVVQEITDDTYFKQIDKIMGLMDEKGIIRYYGEKGEVFDWLTKKDYDQLVKLYTAYHKWFVACS